jgi:hypothetical protein
LNDTKVIAKETGLDELQQKISYPYDVNSSERMAFDA